MFTLLNLTSCRCSDLNLGSRQEPLMSLNVQCYVHCNQSTQTQPESVYSRSTKTTSAPRLGRLTCQMIFGFRRQNIVAPDKLAKRVVYPSFFVFSVEDRRINRPDYTITLQSPTNATLKSVFVLRFG